MAESFFATFKSELIHRQRWSSRSVARQAIFEYLEVFDHLQRRHSALGYLSPIAFEALHAHRVAAYRITVHQSGVSSEMPRNGGEQAVSTVAPAACAGCARPMSGTAAGSGTGAATAAVPAR